MKPEIQRSVDEARRLAMSLQAEELSVSEIFSLYFAIAELGPWSNLPIKLKFDMEYIHSRLMDSIPCSLDGLALTFLAKDLYKQVKDGNTITTNPEVKAFIIETAEVVFYINKMVKTDHYFCYSDIEKFKRLEMLYMNYCKEAVFDVYVKDMYTVICIHINNFLKKNT